MSKKNSVDGSTVIGAKDLLNRYNEVSQQAQGGSTMQAYYNNTSPRQLLSDVSTLTGVMADVSKNRYLKTAATVLDVADKAATLHAIASGQNQGAENSAGQIYSREFTPQQKYAEQNMKVSSLMNHSFDLGDQAKVSYASALKQSMGMSEEPGLAGDLSQDFDLSSYGISEDDGVGSLMQKEGPDYREESEDVGELLSEKSEGWSGVDISSKQEVKAGGMSV